MKISDIIIWILFVLSLVVLGWYILGNSPTLEEAMIVFMLSSLFILAIKLSGINSDMYWVKKKLNRMEESIIRMARDVKEIKETKK